MALETSEETPSTTTASSILSQKVSRALEVRTDTAAMKAALDALARLPDSGEMDSRSVRVAIERDALQQALSLQKELQTLVDTVSELRQGLASVASIANNVNDVIHTNVVTPTTSDETQDDEDALEEELRLATLLSDAFQDQYTAKERAETVNAFLDRFDLDPRHAALLDTFDFSDISGEEAFLFLEALERVKAIRQELSRLSVLSDDAHLGATSAIRMMESLATKQERAYERLYHWLQTHLHLTTTNNNNSSQQVEQHAAFDEALVHPFVRRSLQTLKHVPAFYSHTLELICQSRRVQVTRKFLLALTSGPSPMEMKAHDPVAYVGDMLAFCFQSCSVEADTVQNILQNEEEETPEEDDDTTTDALMSADEMLAHAMSGIARPLKSRISQVVAALARHDGENMLDDEDDDDEQEGAQSRVVSLYNICGLLLFYHSALLKTVSSENPLVVSVLECLKEASQAYTASLRVYAAMLDSLSMVTGDSEASLVQSLIAALSQVRTDSPGFGNVSCPSPELQTSLSLEFLAETLVKGASCKTLDDAVTLKSCLVTTKNAGLSSTTYAELQEEISKQEQGMVDAIVDEATGQVLELCGLAGLSTALANMLPVEGMTMAHQAGLSQPEVESAVKEFYSSLYAPPLPTFESIQDPILRKSARTKIADRVCKVYQDLYQAMQTGGYEDLKFLIHSPDKVATLFSP